MTPQVTPSPVRTTCWRDVLITSAEMPPEAGLALEHLIDRQRASAGRGLNGTSEGEKA